MASGLHAIALFAAAFVGCAASTRPRENPDAFRAAAVALGGRAAARGCALDAGELADRTIAEWSARSSEAWAPDWACLAIQDNLSRDSMGSCTPPPADVFGRPLSFARRIAGELFYVGLDPREYTYDLVPHDDLVEIEVRVQFLGPLAQDPARIATLQDKMHRAADLWTRYSPGGRFFFRFIAETTDAALPHFQVHLDAGSTRTPFDVTWGEEWSWHLLAHEIGHMMGLDDEYGQLRKTLGHAIGEDKRWDVDPVDKVRWFQCDSTSLMCDSKGEASTPLRYHYYLLLRRRFCRVTPPDRDVVAP